MWWKFVQLFGKLERPIERALVGAPSAEMLARGQALFPGHTLYHFQGSPFALRVRLALHRLGLGLPMKDILEDPVAQDELVRLGGRDRIPCLRIEEPGKPPRWMYESKEIAAYLQDRAHAKSTSKI